VYERGPDHSSRETSHPESKLLKKHEQKPSNRSHSVAETARGRPNRHRDTAGIALISLHIRSERQKSAYRRVYPVLTMFGKDCGQISQKRHSAFERPANADGQSVFKRSGYRFA
jgi:hypothetical protein